MTQYRFDMDAVHRGMQGVSPDLDNVVDEEGSPYPSHLYPDLFGPTSLLAGSEVGLGLPPAGEDVQRTIPGEGAWYYGDPMVEARRAANMEDRSAARRALTAGWHQYGPGFVHGLTGLAGSVIEEIPGMSGVGERIKEGGFDRYQESMRRAYENPQNIESLRDIESAGDFLTWAGEQMVKFLPQMGMMMLGGFVARPVAGAAVSSVAGRAMERHLAQGMIARRAAKIKVAETAAGKKMTDAQARKMAEEQFRNTMAVRLGAGAQVTGMYGGSNWAEVYQDFGIDNPVSALATAAGAGLMNMIGGQTALIESVLGRAKGQALQSALAGGNKYMAVRIASEFARKAPKAAVEEFGQESLALINRLANDPDVESGLEGVMTAYLEPENIWRPLESAATVAVAATGPHALHAGLRGGPPRTRGDQPAPPPTESTTPESEAQAELLSAARVKALPNATLDGAIAELESRLAAPDAEAFTAEQLLQINKSLDILRTEKSRRLSDPDDAAVEPRTRGDQPAPPPTESTTPESEAQAELLSAARVKALPNATLDGAIAELESRLAAPDAEAFTAEQLLQINKSLDILRTEKSRRLSDPDDAAVEPTPADPKPGSKMPGPGGPPPADPGTVEGDGARDVIEQVSFWIASDLRDGVHPGEILSNSQWIQQKYGVGPELVAHLIDMHMAESAPLGLPPGLNATPMGPYGPPDAPTPPHIGPLPQGPAFPGPVYEPTSGSPQGPPPPTPPQRTQLTSDPATMIPMDKQSAKGMAAKMQQEAQSFDSWMEEFQAWQTGTQTADPAVGAIHESPLQSDAQAAEFQAQQRAQEQAQIAQQRIAERQAQEQAREARRAQTQAVREQERNLREIGTQRRRVIQGLHQVNAKAASSGLTDISQNARGLIQALHAGQIAPEQAEILKDELRAAMDVARGQARGTVPGRSTADAIDTTAVPGETVAPQTVTPGDSNVIDTRGTDQAGGIEREGGPGVGDDAGRAGVADVLDGQGVAVGRRVGITTGRGTEQTVYAVVEAGDVVASHVPEQGFQVDPRYRYQNERDYERDAWEQAKVLEESADERFDPDRLIRDNVDANNGAPVVDQDFNVLGGNGRAMMIKIAYGRGGKAGARYRQELLDRAESLGFDPGVVAGMNNPVLVRVLDRVVNQQEGQDYIPLLNNPFTQARSKNALGFSRSKLFAQRTLNKIAVGVAKHGTLRKYSGTTDSDGLADMLVQDGVIQTTERNQYIDKDGRLSVDGVEFLEVALRGLLFSDYATMNTLPGYMLKRIDRTLASVAAMKGMPKPWDITAKYAEAVKIVHGFLHSSEKEFDAFTNKNSLFGEKLDSFAAKLAKHLANTSLSLTAHAEMWGRYVGFAKQSLEGQSALPGLGKSYPEVLRDVFGINVVARPATQQQATQQPAAQTPAQPPTQPPPTPDQAEATPAPAAQATAPQSPADTVGAIHESPLQTDATVQADTQGAGAQAQPLPTLWKDLMALGKELGVFKVGMKRSQVEQAIRDARAGQTQGQPPAEQQPVASDYGTKNTVFTQDAAEAARALLREKLKTQLSSGIDPQIVQAGITPAGYHVEAGARQFADFAKAMINDLGDAVRPYLRSWYEAVRFHPGFDNTGMSTAEQVEQQFKEMQDAVNELDGRNLEQDGQGAGVGDGLGQGSVPAGRPGDGGQGGSGVAGTDGAGSGLADSQRVRGLQAAPVGTEGDAQVPPGESGPDGGRGVAGDQPAGRGSGLRGGGSLPGRGSAGAASGTVPGTGPRSTPDLTAADKVAVVPMDADNIAKTLPALFENQHKDVKFAEDRFSKPEQTGVLFTNMTGTGKTGSGLGIAKRFDRQGKSNILVVVPSDKIANDWVDFARDRLGMKLTRLENTKTAGEGPVITTYANLGMNAELINRQWDLVVLDEAQRLMQAKQGTKTTYLDNLRALTLHPRGVAAKAEMLHPDEVAEMARLQEQREELVVKIKDKGISETEKAGLEQQLFDADRRRNQLARVLQATRERLQPEFEAAQGTDQRAKVVMLSATPFAYEANVDMAEGYLFDYPEVTRRGGYNQPDPQQLFMIQHFGYRMRTGKLTRPGPKVNSGLMQRNFNEWLKQNRVLSGQMLDLPYDYDRRFVVTPSAEGQLIDKALDYLRENSRMKPIRDHIESQFDYLSRRYLLEAIKAREAIPIIQQHLDLGRKVVVFHDYKKGGGFNPFQIQSLLNNQGTVILEDGQTAAIADLAQEFMDAHQDLVNMDFGIYRSPITALTQAFNERLALYNGSVPANQRLANAEAFQNDNSGVDVILVQSAAGREGISLHDRTGGKQRVLINLGLPTTPTTSIQQEGRIYRYGQASDAILRYMTTGTNWERFAFARVIAERASTAENLALGAEARGLLDSFVNAYLEADAYPPGHANEGLGGKEIDRALRQALTEWDRAMTAYHGQQKKTARTKAAEGADYFATPEPLGLKMVEWADVKPGEDALEPSSGHGAIARWFPETTNVVFVEPSAELVSRASLVVPHGKALDHRFEDLHAVNKFDTIVMNPPFGTAGATARDHLAKAATHLRDGGRIVVLVPTGPGADAKINKWLASSDAKGIYLSAEIILPRATFERAGTKVATRILVLDRLDVPDLAQGIVTRTMDFSDAQTVNDLFERIKDVGIPPRRVIPDAYKVQQDVPLDEAKVITYTTKRGYQIDGIVRKNIPLETAREIDPYAWRMGSGKNKGVFIALRHKEALRHWEQTGELPHQAAAQAGPPQAVDPGAETIGGYPVVEHVTKKGKAIRGVIRPDMTQADAKRIDPFTWRKDGGYFIRVEHQAALEAYDATRRTMAMDDALAPRFSLGDGGEATRLKDMAANQPVHPHQAFEAALEGDLTDDQASALFDEYSADLDRYNELFEEWVAELPDLAQFSSGDNLQVAHRSVEGSEYPWRVTSFTRDANQQWVPSGHTEHQTKFQAVNEASANGMRSYLPEVRFSLGDAQPVPAATNVRISGQLSSQAVTQSGQRVDTQEPAPKGMSVRAVEKAIGPMQAGASGAVPTVVFESQAEIREKLPAVWDYMVSRGYDKKLVQGFFNTQDGQVYLIADNLNGRSHAVEIWLHEQVGHAGIESVLGADANAFYAMIQKERGLETIEQAREYLANIVQKINLQQKLDAQEQTLWRKIVDFIRKTLMKLGLRPMLAREEIVRAVTSALNTQELKQHLDLVQAGMERVFLGDYQAAPALATGNRGTFDPANPDIRFSMSDSPASDPVTTQQQSHNQQIMTTLDHLFSGTSLEGLGDLVKRKGKGALPENIRMVLPDEDMGKLHMLGLPEWQAKKFPVYGEIVKREGLRREQSAQMRAEFFRNVESFMKLDSASTAVVQDMLWGRHGIEGVDLEAEGVTADKFLEVKNAQGQPSLLNGPALEINPAYMDQLEAALRKRFAPGGVWADSAQAADTVIPAYMDMRRALDTALVSVYDIMRHNLGDKVGEIDQFRNFISTYIHNYFPHNRYGKYHVRAVNEKGDTVYREHFDLGAKRLTGRKRNVLQREGQKRIDEVIASDRAKYGAEGLTWEIGENLDLPEDVYSFPIPMDAMEQILKKAQDQIDKAMLQELSGAMKNAPESERVAAAKRMKQTLEGLMPKAVADTLKERGFTMHAISRKNIPGFEQADLKKVLYDYGTGWAGWSTKIEASKDFTKTMSKLDARARPREYKAATQYVQDMLRNQDDIDRIAGNVKSVFFFSYLGAQFKTPALNLTQNVILGTPRLAMDIGVGRAMRWYKDAGRLIADQIAGKGGISDDAQAMLKELYEKGILDARYLNEIRGQVSKFGVSSFWDKILNVAGIPMAWSDKFNRASLALAAYEAARKGHVTNKKTLEKYGMQKGQAFDHDQAMDFASKVTTDAHFVYGKSNAPEILRSSAAGRAISPVYTFRTFSHNLWNAWINMYQQGGPQARKALALSLAGTVALGGLKSIPLYASMLALWNVTFGGDDDPVEWVRENWIPELDGGRPNLLRDIATYGAPSIMGVNMGGSIRMETPMVPRLQPGQDMREASLNAIQDILGIPWDFFFVRPSKAVEALKVGESTRAMEEMAPVFLKSMMRSVRMATEGATALSGRPITLPGETDPRKFDLSDALIKALSFQPVSAAKAWDLHSSLARSQGVKQTQQSKYMSRLTRALRAQDQKAIDKVYAEIITWNERALKRGDYHMIIRREDIRRALQARDRPRGYARALAPEVARRTELYQ